MADQNPNTEIPTTPVEETISATVENKPCTSCAMSAVNKSLKANYWVAGISTFGLIATIASYKRFQNANRLLLGIAGGIFGTLLFFSIQKIVNLSSYKAELNKLEPATT